MPLVKPKTRLRWSITMVLSSIVYGVFIIIDADLASAVMLGYVGFLLTIFVMNEIWKNHG